MFNPKPNAKTRPPLYPRRVLQILTLLSCVSGTVVSTTTRDRVRSVPGDTNTRASVSVTGDLEVVDLPRERFVETDAEQVSDRTGPRVTVSSGPVKAACESRIDSALNVATGENGPCASLTRPGLDFRSQRAAGGQIERDGRLGRHFVLQTDLDGKHKERLLVHRVRELPCRRIPGLGNPESY